MQNQKKYVITGCSGSGKTAVTNEIASRGYTTVPEAAELVKVELHQKTNTALHWPLLVEKQQELEQLCTDTLFLDRGLLDVIVYCQFEGIDVPLQVISAAEKTKYAQAFVLTTFSNYKQEYEQGFSREQVDMLVTLFLDVYSKFGCKSSIIVEKSIRERADFILSSTMTTKSPL